MSDNNTLHYGKGIPVTSGFDLGAKSPLDSRMVVANFEELQLHIDGNRAYEGMLVYVNSEKKLYVYNGTDWEELTTNVDADNPIFDVVDNLESTATDAPLSANQGRILKETINGVEETLIESINNVETTLEETISNVETTIGEKISNVETVINNVEVTIDGVEIALEETVNSINNVEATLGEKINNVETTLETTIRETISNVEDKLEQLIEESAGKGTANIHVGTEPPEDTKAMWVDTSNTNVERRLRNKYTRMLRNVQSKIEEAMTRLVTIENQINRISADNAMSASQFRINVALARNSLNSLRTRVSQTITSIENGASLEGLKASASQERAEIRNLLFSMSDLNHEVMQVIDSEMGLIIQPDPDNPSTPDDDDNITSQVLLAENGLAILTEDGLMLLLDGYDSPTTPSNALLTELGQVILTEDGSMILIDGAIVEENDGVLADAILTELGKVILLENGKQLLKG